MDDETVHPLLVAGWRARPRPVATTPRPGARLRTVTWRGVATAALLYDALPVVDVFRGIDDGVLLGVMDLRGLDAPFFFVLEKAA